MPLGSVACVEFLIFVSLMLSLQKPELFKILLIPLNFLFYWNFQHAHLRELLMDIYLLWNIFTDMLKKLMYILISVFFNLIHVKNY